jgi:hypothetical protein
LGDSIYPSPGSVFFPDRLQNVENSSKADRNTLDEEIREIKLNQGWDYIEMSQKGNRGEARALIVYFTSEVNSSLFLG